MFQGFNAWKNLICFAFADMTEENYTNLVKDLGLLAVYLLDVYFTVLFSQAVIKEVIVKFFKCLLCYYSWFVLI